MEFCCKYTSNLSCHVCLIMTKKNLQMIPAQDPNGLETTVLCISCSLCAIQQQHSLNDQIKHCTSAFFCNIFFVYMHVQCIYSCLHLKFSVHVDDVHYMYVIVTYLGETRLKNSFMELSFQMTCASSSVMLRGLYCTAALQGFCHSVCELPSTMSITA